MAEVHRKLCDKCNAEADIPNINGEEETPKGWQREHDHDLCPECFADYNNAYAAFVKLFFTGRIMRYRSGKSDPITACASPDCKGLAEPNGPFCHPCTNRMIAPPLRKTRR